MRSIQNKKGFTLVELLITIFIVSVGLVGALSFFSTNINSQFETKNELIAAGLAQEAPELIRNIADYNYLSGVGGWYSGLTNSAGGGSSCKTVDYGSLSSHSCISASNNDDTVCKNASERYFQYDCTSSAGTKTDFKRTISLQGVRKSDLSTTSGVDLNGGDCLKATATVTWGDKKTQAVDIICKPRN